ncbi:hypothetical protein ABT56_12095 [Photobacterium aquae]|uniref:Uncharacterized protein n=1 Tax=Photobacterium aquae TaxID=1195763 RepID=A0A0J1H0T0_9GAMM|nr:hypothetical protein [Photobacterium aquae]KLV05440.1 hypothetical protein ABT56_12095 [Photobacterium aquae]
MKYKLLLLGLLLSVSGQSDAIDNEKSVDIEYEKIEKEMALVELEWERLFALEEQGIIIDQKEYDALTEKQQTLTRKKLLRQAGKNTSSK